MKEWLHTAQDVALSAGDLIREAWDRPRSIEHKGEVDLVTETDKQAEVRIVEQLSRAYPEHRIVAEEGSGIDDGDSEFAWYVDPIDGTTNFAHGYPHVAVSIGLALAGEPVLGVVLDVMRGEVFAAVKGEGATCNGNPLRVSNVTDLDGALLGTGFPYDRREHAASYLRYVEDFLRRVQGLRRAGTASLDLCWTASGRIDGFWELQLKPWDVAAGIVIIREAGGLVTDFHGTPSRVGGEQVLASNGRIHARMAEILATRLAAERNEPAN